MALVGVRFPLRAPPVSSVLAGHGLAPSGRLVTLVWQRPEPNECIREISRALAADPDQPSPPIGAPGPFAQADPDHVKAVLAAARFTNIALSGLRAPMWFGTDARDAHQFVLGLMGWMLDRLDHTRRREALDDLRTTLDAHHSRAGVCFESAAWLIQARLRRSV